ncbi:OmpW family outer membrane protein [Novosphingobium sp.]|jgi:outer membrane protein|uniref:OmpW/AlkL family protein n=1 Tax=Novosphingobium sp. TaxID=1874826 RepID=UPI001ECD6365|nr:OmpW family outer membrane protein [Novosphingobium sp.]MBK6800008.1 outer membrane beta-barrel protein [Novosphingobium sp.]MBK9010978.1 outer membrane beta-barrel protein [Novosphingobium sp.]
MFKPAAAAAAFAASLALAAPAHAGSPEGKLQVKVMATGVLPDGKITRVQTNAIGAPATSDSEASNSVVPTLAVEYFVSPNFSIETICCVTPHDVTGKGGLAGAKLVDNAIILPATVTLKYHFDLGGVKPYVGAGPAHFFIFSEGVGADAAALGATRVDLSNRFGLALQAGMDVPLNDRGLGFSLDAKRYFVDTTASFYAGNTLALRTDHSLDPWVVSGGLSYRF